MRVERVSPTLINSHPRLTRPLYVISSYIYGNVLVVDDVIQRTERDKVLYDESLAHLALSCHPDPKKVYF